MLSDKQRKAMFEKKKMQGAPAMPKGPSPATLAAAMRSQGKGLVK